MYSGLAWYTLALAFPCFRHCMQKHGKACSTRLLWPWSLLLCPLYQPVCLLPLSQLSLSITSSQSFSKVKFKTCLGCGLGGVCDHIKAFTPFPYKKPVLNTDVSCLLGRTLQPHFCSSLPSLSYTIILSK